MTAETVETADQGDSARREPRGRASWHDDWRVLLLFFTLAGVVESQAFGHLGAFTPLFLQQLDIPRQQIPQWTGILSALGFVFGLPLLPFWGAWADRYGRKLIIVRSAYIEGVLFTIAAFAPNVWVLAVARFLGGFVFGNTGIMLALLADRTPRHRLGLAVGIASAGFPLGSALGPFIGGLIAQGPGIRTLLFLDACASALMGLVLTLVIREGRSRPRSTEPTGRLLRDALASIVSSPVVVRLFALYFAAMFGVSLAVPFVPILLQRLYRGPEATVPSMIGTTLTCAGIAMAVTTPLWGRLGDLVGRGRVLPICVAAVGVGVLVEGLAPTLVPLQAAIIWIGLFQGGIGASVIALLALLAPPERRNPILTFSLLPTQVSWFVGPITGAALASVTFRLPFYSGAIALAIAVGLAVVILRRIPSTASTSGASSSAAGTSAIRADNAERAETAATAGERG